MIHAPTSTKNLRRQPDPDMHATRKGQQIYFGMKAPLGVEAPSGLIHPVVGTAANVSHVRLAHQLLHAQETAVYADAGYPGVAKRPEHQNRQVNGQVRRPRIGGLPAQEEAMLRALRLKERAKAALRAKVDPVFRTLKCPFGFTQGPYQGLAKNTAQ